LKKVKKEFQKAQKDLNKCRYDKAIHHFSESRGLTLEYIGRVEEIILQKLDTFDRVSKSTLPDRTEYKPELN